MLYSNAVYPIIFISEQRGSVVLSGLFMTAEVSLPALILDPMILSSILEPANRPDLPARFRLPSESAIWCHRV